MNDSIYKISRGGFYMINVNLNVIGSVIQHGGGGEPTPSGDGIPLEEGGGFIELEDSDGVIIEED